MRNNIRCLLLALTMILVSCQDDNGHSTYNGQLGKLEQKDSAKKENVSVKADKEKTEDTSLEIKISSLSTEVSSLKQKVTSLNSQLDKNHEENSNQSVMVVVVIALILVATFLFFLFRYMLKKTKNQFYEQFKLIDSKLSSLGQGADQELRNYRDAHSVEHKKLVDSINNYLQDIYKKLPNSPGCGPKSSQPRPDDKPRGSMKTCYFGMIKVGGGVAFFNDVWEYKNDGAFFEMETSDDKVCTFKPFDIHRLKPLDVLEEAVEYDGCPLQDAKTILKIKQKGMAEYQPNNGGYWKITRKAIITIG